MSKKMQLKLSKIVRRTIFWLFGITIVIILWDFISLHKWLFLGILGGAIVLMLLIGATKPGTTKSKVLKALGYR